MILKKIDIYFALAGIGLLSMSSCNENEQGILKPSTDPLSGDVYAEFSTKAGNEDPGESDSDVIFDATTGEHDDNDEARILFKDGFDLGDALYFTQLVSGVLPPFQGKNADDYPPTISPDFKEDYPNGYGNIYKYYYYPQYPTEWEDEPKGLGGYNFFAKNPLTDEEGVKMEWEAIQAWGYDVNGFTFYAMYYPIDNELNLDFRVPVDQRNIDDLRRANFIGAYHSSSSPSRLRFKLYHLLCYFKLTLYVPVFNDNDVDEKGNKIRTGFPADAIQDVQLLDVLTDFDINWYANPTTDTAPVTAAVKSSERNDVYMFLPPLTKEFYPDTDGLPPVVNLKTSSFYRPDDEGYNPDATDLCWKITLSALIPAGQDFTADDPNYPGMVWTDKNFIRIHMRQNIGEVPKSYVFNGNPKGELGGHLTTDSDLTIAQGGIQHLSLYIPRYGAAAVLVGANVNDWKYRENNNMGMPAEDPLRPSGGGNTGPEPEPEEPEPEPGPTD